MNARDLYKEYGAGAATVEYGYCVNGIIISIKETIEISERECQKDTPNGVEHCKRCTLSGAFP